MTVRAKSTSRRGSKKAMKAGTRATKRRTTSRPSYSSYVNKVLKNVTQGNLTISSKAMAIVNSFVNDNFELLASEASRLANLNRRSTISAREIKSAACLLLPRELADHAMQEGSRAIKQYST